jgi:hypothetical protein
VRRLFGLAAAAILVAAIIFGIDFYRHRYVRHNRDLVRLLPVGDLNLIYADIDTLRRAGLLGVLSNIKVAPDKEYDSFIAETGFDYTRDLDAIAVATDASRTFLAGRGRFHWDKLKAFANSHGGTCEADACRVPATTPGRWVNFISVQPDVLAVAISPTQTAADELRPPGRRLQEQIPNAPVWAKLSHDLLTHPIGLPVPLQIFAISLQSAESAILSAELQSLHLKAHFANAAAAETGRRQLEIQTRTLTTALQQNNQRSDRATMAGLLTAGSFHVIGTDVLGTWPIYPELLKAIQ